MYYLTDEPNEKNTLAVMKEDNLHSMSGGGELVKLSLLISVFFSMKYIFI